MKLYDLMSMGLFPLNEATQDKFNLFKEMAPMRFSMFATIEEIKTTLAEQRLPEEDVYLTTGLYDVVLFDGKWAFMEYHNFPGMDIAGNWKKFKERMNKWEQKKDYDTLMSFVPKAYKKSIVEHNLHEIPEQDRRSLLIDIRTSSEYQFEEFDEEVFVPEMLKSKDGAEDLQELKKLHPEEVVTIYRGETPQSTELENALSWTTKIEFAEFFANRFSSEGVIYQAEVEFDKILAFTERESEVLVQFDDLMNIRELSDYVTKKRKSAN